MEPANPPTHLPRPPRVARGGVGCGLWFLRLFIMPHMCVGVALFAFWILTVIATVFGTETSAVVTKTHVTKGSKGGTNYSIDYRYSVDGQSYTNSSSVEHHIYATVDDPQKIEEGLASLRIRHIGLGSWHSSLVQEKYSWKKIGFLLFAMLFWNGIMSVFVYIAWVAPLRTRWLVRHGIATPGTIVGRRKVYGKRIQYYVTFKFQEPVSGQEFQREMQVPGEKYYDIAKEGRAVTVLYKPGKRKRSLVYELCGYHVDGAVAG